MYKILVTQELKYIQKWLQFTQIMIKKHKHLSNNSSFE